MSPYYQKFHTLSTPPNSTHEHLGLDYVDQKIHGYRGPIQASFAGTPQDALSNAWYKTFQSLGYEGKGDPFSGEFVGGYNSPATIDPVSKERSYSAVAYYQPIKNRSNLTLLTGALVDKIELEATERTGLFTATAVRLIHNGETKIVRAHKEVIVAAGTFNSPKLLELSGIGSATLLRSHDIPLLIDSPGVGENLQDHLMTGFSFEVNNGVNTIDDLARKDPVAIQMALQQYMESKSGPFTAAGVNSMAFMPLVNPLSDDNMEATKICLDKNIADAKSSIHYDFIRSILENANEGSASFFTYPAGGNFEIGGGFDVENATKAVLDGNYITIGVCLLHPLSRGSVHIGSGDPAQKPKIDPKYLTQELDVEVFARHVQSLRKLVKTQPLASLLKVDGRRNSPDVDLTDLEAVKQYARSTAISNWHPVGTCAMMPREKGGVVDEKLLVHGTANLRVVDASIFPMITRGNPLTSVYAVAEKAADLIKKGDNS